jgi:uncharacterized membrane protein YgcG
MNIKIHQRQCSLRGLYMTFLLICLAALPLAATNVVNNIDISVVLDHNGTAHFTEVWDIDVEDEITEWYIGKPNLHQMQIKDLSITDETGVKYVCEDNWIIDRTRAEKQGRCGITHPKGNDCEICWGVGSMGAHSYKVSYTMTNFLKGLNDADAFNFMFVNHLDNEPRHSRVTISSPVAAFTHDNTRVWGFLYKGSIDVIDGKVIAETQEEWEGTSNVVALVAFNKGIFNPTLRINEPFSVMRDRALAGSSYEAPKKDLFDRSVDFLNGIFGETAGSLVLIMLIIIIPVTLLLLFKFALRGIFVNGASYVKKFFKSLWYYITLRPLVIRAHRKDIMSADGSIAWFRDIPCGGNLYMSNAVYQKFSYMPTGDNTVNLIGAYILRLLYCGAIEMRPTTNKKGEMETVMFINPEWKPVAIADTGAKSKDQTLQNQLFTILLDAAGKDHILQKGELKGYAKYNSNDLLKWYKGLKKDLAWDKCNLSDAKKIFGLKKFLEDFSLINERFIVEVKLWNEYLVFATMFGIADRVRKDFKTYCPEYFTMRSNAETALIDAQTEQDFATDFTSVIFTTIMYYQVTSTWSSITETFNSGSSLGGGGMASFGGGGGGFEGGGSSGGR